MNHSFVSDYFAVGVIAYELMTGKVNPNLSRDRIMADPAIKSEILCSPRMYNSKKIKSLRIGAMKQQTSSTNLSAENLRTG